MSGNEETKKFEYQYHFEHKKIKDPRLRGIVGIYYKKKSSPSIKVRFPLYMVQPIEIFSLYLKNKGFKTFNRWFLSVIEREIKKLTDSEDPEFILAKKMYEDILRKENQPE